MSKDNETSKQDIEKEAEEIIKRIIPNGIQNVKGKGDGKPQYRAEIEAIKKCMFEFAGASWQASQQSAPPDVCRAALDDQIVQLMNVTGRMNVLEAIEYIKGLQVETIII